MKLMRVHRSRFDHRFKPQNAVGAALTRVTKIIVGSPAANPNRRAPAAMALKSTSDTLLPELSTTCARAQIPIAALQSP